MSSKQYDLQGVLRRLRTVGKAVTEGDWGSGQTEAGKEDKMSLPYSHKLIARARYFRKSLTKEERKLWYDFLRRYPVRFQRQKTIESFIVDFYCHEALLVIEVDGDQHHSAQGMAYDQERTAILQQYALHVLRFSNAEVNDCFPTVCKTIDQVVQKRLKTEKGEV